MQTNGLLLQLISDLNACTFAENRTVDQFFTSNSENA